MKKRILKLGLFALLATNIVICSEAIIGLKSISFAASDTTTEQPAESLNVKGSITNISQKAKTIALSQKDDGFFLLKFNDETQLKGVQSTKEFEVGEAIIVNYKSVDGENIATSLEKAHVKLPKGIKEIKTEELATQLEKNKDIVLIDARPPVKYAESHIAGAISIPYSKVVKMGEEGNKLFEEFKDKQLVFYCGGST